MRGIQQPQHLNGAYYGPSVPPPAKTYHRPGRGGGGGGGCCCDCLYCCGCCIMSIICNILITLAVIVGVLGLIFWLIFRPNIIKFHVTDASLTRFDLSPSVDGNLHYNLALNVTIRNPNRRIGVYYDQINATALYDDRRFATTSLPPFYQGHKNTTVLDAAFVGQNLVNLDGDKAKRFEEERNSGVYSIDLKVWMRIRFKVLFFKSWSFRSAVKCPLRVPIGSSNRTSGLPFEDSTCHLSL